jgi:hypothetical protein
MMRSGIVDKKLALLLVGLLPSMGCAAMPASSSAQAPSPTPVQSDCAEAPTGTLNPANVSRVDVRSGTAAVSGMASAGQLVGYNFQGEKNQRFSYTPQDSDLCVWVYTPDNKILKAAELPMTGSYVVQVGTKQGKKDFNIQINVSEFSSADFPKSTCGDSLPTDLSKYPVSFYPVLVSYTEDNLREAQSKFCTDSFQKKSKDTGEQIVQISSFLTQKKAEAFANFVRPDISEVKLGSATVVTEPKND